MLTGLNIFSINSKKNIINLIIINIYLKKKIIFYNIIKKLNISFDYKLIKTII
jgi:hypothetical protein